MLTLLKHFVSLLSSGFCQLGISLFILLFCTNSFSQSPNTLADLKTLELKASKGDKEAMYQVGRAYANGRIVPKDMKRATKMLAGPAYSGHIEAQLALAKIYANGDGVSKNFSFAKGWYQKAADAGNATAQFKLGMMFERGDGVIRNLPEAAKWYSLAAAGGLPEAKQKLSVLKVTPSAAGTTPIPLSNPIAEQAETPTASVQSTPVRASFGPVDDADLTPPPTIGGIAALNPTVTADKPEPIPPTIATASAYNRNEKEALVIGPDAETTLPPVSVAPTEISPYVVPTRVVGSFYVPPVRLAEATEQPTVSALNLASSATIAITVAAKSATRTPPPVVARGSNGSAQHSVILPNKASEPSPAPATFGVKLMNLAIFLFLSMSMIYTITILVYLLKSKRPLFTELFEPVALITSAATVALAIVLMWKRAPFSLGIFPASLALFMLYDGFKVRLSDRKFLLLVPLLLLLWLVSVWLFYTVVFSR